MSDSIDGKFFKVLMRDKRIAKAVLQQYLPDNIKEIIDLDTLEVINFPKENEVKKPGK